MKINVFVICFLSFVFTEVYCTEAPFAVCDKTKTYNGKVAHVEVNGKLGPGNVIMLKKGTTEHVSFSFQLLKGNYSEVTAVVHGVIHGFDVPFPLDNPNACKNCGLTCPIDAPKQYNYSTDIKVKTSYPTLRLLVKWQLNDKSANAIWCVEMPAEIVD